ncbi:hypothetical protein R9C00_05380 [Flammeovirgaceae bacterium SG7u.111]|nr:hypothetical protein [Flammeovirgaceae bacterium SG7u.132]WPO36872.1 hypothetical protein R9C00_05380 [Flammeovirgaceae bacterium SG7u.111]
MNFKETFNEKPFGYKDEQLISEIKRKDRKVILIVIVMILIISVTPNRNGEYLIDSMTYLNSIIWGASISFGLIGLPVLIFMTRKNADYKNRKKIVIETKIKNIKKYKSDLRLQLTNPNFKPKSIFVHRDKIYPGIKKDDSIRISYLPRTKFVLEIEKT